MLHTAFFGSSSYVLPVLETLKIHTDLRLVVTRPDQPGKRALYPSHPKHWAIKNKIRLQTPEELIQTAPSIKQLIAEEKIDVNIVADYGLVIPKEIFSWPKFKTINIHFSKLPDLRGPSPIQWTILRGDASAWISFFLIEEDVDTGPLIWQEEYPLTGKETSTQLYQLLFQKAAEILPAVLEKYTSAKITPQPQDHSQATFSSRLSRNDGFIPPMIVKSLMQGKTVKKGELVLKNLQSKIINSDLIERAVRAFTPWPGIWTTLSFVSKSYDRKKKIQLKRRLKILKAHVEGKMFILDQVQLEGKKRVSWEEFKRGYPESTF